MKFPTLPPDDARTPERVIFLAQDVELPADLDVPTLAAWLDRVASHYGREISQLTYVLVSDSALLRLNEAHLDHDTLTDIITFDLGDGGVKDPIEGECYISLQRITDNAAEYRVTVGEELSRVVVHGLLHLCGLGDKTAQESAVMRAAEDSALDLLRGR